MLTGADERTRTADLLITNQLLYQLSYVGSGVRILGEGSEGYKASGLCRDRLFLGVDRVEFDRDDA